jgi:thiamine pyrophosphokinase
MNLIRIMPAEGERVRTLPTTSPAEVVFLSNTIVHLFLNGEFLPPPADYQPGPDAVLIAVDGGLRHITSLGLKPTILIGDLDSVGQTEIERAWQAGARVMRFPVEKDETDFELALAEAVRMDPARLIIHAALGGRMDQTLANLALLGSERYAALNLVLVQGPETFRFIRSRLELTGQPGDTVSLLPWEGQAVGVTTTNLKYPLRGETLFPDRSRGISNQMTAATASVSLTNGRLLCIHTRKQ